MAMALQVDFLLSGLINSSGQPLAAGTVTFYETDGVTFKTIWADANQGSTLSNPVTLSARGTAKVFASGPYSIVIKDSTGATVDTDDILTYSVPLSSSAYINAADYGAQNDTTILAAIAAAAGDDRTVYLIPGNWAISNNLTIPSNINLRFEMGSYATIAITKTLTYNGTYQAPDYNVHRGSGTVTFSSKNATIPTIHKISAVSGNVDYTGTHIFDTPTFAVDATNHRVGIGLIAPLTKAHIQITAPAGSPVVPSTTADTLALGNDATNLLNLISGTTGTDQVSGLYFSDDTRGQGRILYRHRQTSAAKDFMEFYTGATLAATFDSSQGFNLVGNLAINTNKFTVAASSGNTVVAGTLGVTSDFAIATNKFTVVASSGNTVVAGTLGVTSDFAIATNKFTVVASSGNTVVAGTLGVTSDFAIATNKFTVAASSGNTVVAGTLNVTGTITGTLATAAQPNITSVGTLSALVAGTASIAGATNASAVSAGPGHTAAALGEYPQFYSGNSGLINQYSQIGFGWSSGSKATAPAAIAYKITSAAGDTKGDLIFATRDVTTQTTPTERARITSAGDFSIATSMFTVAAATGNTVVAGTLGVTSDFAIATNKFTVAASSGNTVVAGTLNVTGTITGTLATAAQPNITSVGTISALVVGARKMTMSSSGKTQFSWFNENVSASNFLTLSTTTNGDEFTVFLTANTIGASEHIVGILHYRNETGTLVRYTNATVSSNVLTLSESVSTSSVTISVGSAGGNISVSALVFGAGVTTSS